MSKFAKKLQKNLKKLQKNLKKLVKNKMLILALVILVVAVVFLVYRKRETFYASECCFPIVHTKTGSKDRTTTATPVDESFKPTALRRPGGGGGDGGGGGGGGGGGETTTATPVGSAGEDGGH